MDSGDLRHPAAIGSVDLYQELAIPRQFACQDRHSELIPGMAEAAAPLRARGMKIGTTTGYKRRQNALQ
jgi:beta-phosphoglucomutase-like phosphatase (HAD superfamily)